MKKHTIRNTIVGAFIAGTALIIGKFVKRSAFREAPYDDTDSVMYTM